MPQPEFNVPSQLSVENRWILWNDESGRKVPYSAHGGHGKSNDPATWSSYEESFGKIETVTGGLGFCLGDGFGGIDMDDCRDPETGELTDWAREVLDRFAGTYYEISPSETGIKIFLRLDDWPHANVRKMDVGKFEVYCTGRYFTVTGRQMSVDNSIDSCPEAIAWLVEKYFPPQPKVERVVVPIADFDLRTRADDYLSNCTVPLPGGRNQQVFSVAGHLLAMGLSLEETTQMLLGWNMSFPEPMDTKEVEACCRNADSKGVPREEKPAGEMLVDSFKDVDLSTLMRSFDVVAVPPEPHKPYVEPKNMEAMDGHTGSTEMPLPQGVMLDFIAWCRETAMIDQPEFALAGSIAWMSRLVERKLADALGNRANMYLVCLGSAGCGKEHPRACIKELLHLGGMSHFDSISSGIAIVKHVQDSKAELWLCDEFGKFLSAATNRRASPHIADQINILLKMYSSAGQTYLHHYTDKQMSVEVDKPFLSVFGTATPETYFGSITHESVDDGLLPRILGFLQHSNAKLRRISERRRNRKPLPSLVESTMAWADYEPIQEGNLGAVMDFQPTVVQFTAAAENAFDDFAAECHGRKHPIWKRAAEKAARLALCHAASCQGPPNPQASWQIDFVDVRWGIAVSELATRRAIGEIESHVADNDAERDLKKIIQVIKKAGGSMTMSQLARATQSIKLKSRKEYLQDLVEQRMIEIDLVVLDAGKPTTIVRLI